MTDIWEDIKNYLEPIGRNFYVTAEADIQLSIAISLKRIADSMEKANKPPVMADIKMTEEEYQRWYNCHPGSIVNKP
jgi:hypothetical protein